jgi:hypothetical protein
MIARFSFLAAAMLATTACAAIKRSPSVGEAASAMLMVDNQSMADMVIYMAPLGGVNTRLGDAPALRVSRLVIRGYLLRGAGDMNFVAEPRNGRGAARSERTIYVAPGDTIRLTIQR